MWQVVVFSLLLAALSSACVHWIARVEPTRVAVILAVIYGVLHAMFSSSVDNPYLSSMTTFLLICVNIVATVIGVITGSKYTHSNYYGWGGWGIRVALTVVSPILGNLMFKLTGATI